MFVCFDPPNTEDLCAACNNMNGPFCLPGNTCANNVCARYCCDDSECGSGTCDKSFFGGVGLGVCSQ